MFLLIDRDKLPGAPPGSGAFADVREVASAHLAAWRHPTHGEQFLLGGAQASFLELIRTIARELGRKEPSRPLPAGFLRGYARVLDAISRLTGREPQLTPQAVSFTCHDLRVDSAKAMRELGYPVGHSPAADPLLHRKRRRTRSGGASDRAGGGGEGRDRRCRAALHFRLGSPNPSGPQGHRACE
jgi:hypothetical protein